MNNLNKAGMLGDPENVTYILLPVHFSRSGVFKELLVFEEEIL